MAKIGDELDFKALEIELKKSIIEDERYWKENDAKLRAVAQNVPTYEDFSDMVKAAHLKPLDRSEKLGCETQQRGCIWNSFVDKSHGTSTEDRKGTGEIPINKDHEEETLTRYQLIRKINEIENNKELFTLLMKIGADRLGTTLKSEFPSEIFGKLIDILFCFSENPKEIAFVCQILDAITKTYRFKITLEFMSQEEKNSCKKLLKMLEETVGLQEGRFELENLGVTLSTIADLGERYKVACQRCDTF